ncbi:hypothetical protein Tco_0795912 [Tanacetum coccineum]
MHHHRDTHQLLPIATTLRHHHLCIYSFLTVRATDPRLPYMGLKDVKVKAESHARTTRLIEAEARLSREAWGRSMDASDLARAEVMSLRTQVVAQAVITEYMARTTGDKRLISRDAGSGPQETGTVH